MRLYWWLLLCVACAAPLAGCSGKDPQAVSKLKPASQTATLPPSLATPTPSPTPIPPPELILSTNDVYQAGAILVSLVGDAASGTVTFLNRSYPLTQGTQSIYAMVGAGADDPPGPTTLRVDFALKTGSKGSLTAPVNVLANTWTVDEVQVGSDLTPLLAPQVATNEQAILDGVYKQVTPQKLWNPTWIMPVEGPITTRFGEQRSYNGSPPAGHHSGTDIGAAEGTPVHAANTGKVVLARQLQLRGNMVIIDHGGGLFSGYAHMTSFAVAEGQMVNQGDIIGYVGSTGLSTGAHLHWEMSAGGVVLDAMRFLDGSNGF